MASLQINAAKIEQLADEHPDLREAYMAKVSDLQKRRQFVSDKDKVVKVLDELETTLDQVEQQLKKVDAGKRCFEFFLHTFLIFNQFQGRILKGFVIQNQHKK